MCLRVPMHACAGVLDIGLQLPSGERTMRRFQAASSVKAVLDFACWQDASIDIQTHQLTRSYPRQVSSASGMLGHLLAALFCQQSMLLTWMW